MSGKLINLGLKVPTRPPTLLRVLENSLLEALVDYKPLAAGVDPRAVRSREIPSAYQLKGDVSVIEDQLHIQFTARNLGLHVARIFANTNEVCHPISFIVTRSGEVQGLDSPLPKQGLEQVDVRRSKPSAAQSAATTVANSAASTVRAVESEHRLSHDGPLTPPPRVSPTDHSSTRFGVYSAPDEPNAFERLLQNKRTLHTVPGILSQGSRPVSSTLTTEMFKSIGDSAKLQVPGKFSHNVKVKCKVCSKKTKLSKSINLWDTSFCDSCFKNFFMLKSSIDHFMVPSIKESTIQVPLNKRRTKFATMTKELPDVNLRGLSTTDVQKAQLEFNKFDMEGEGWIDKVILLPLMKACFTPAIPDPTLRQLLGGQPLQSLITNMGLQNRDKVHEIEFLGLMAFVARERHRIAGDMSMRSRFTHHDLAMAYAFQQQQQYAARPQHKKTPSSYQVSEMPDLVEGVRKSFTDSPLSYYQPASMKNQYPPPELEELAAPPESQKTEQEKLQQQQQSLDKNEQGQCEREEPSTEGIEEDPVTLPETPTKCNSTSGKQKSNKAGEMEELKLTGDMNADGWMMY